MRDVNNGLIKSEATCCPDDSPYLLQCAQLLTFILSVRLTGNGRKQT